MPKFIVSPDTILHKLPIRAQTFCVVFGGLCIFTSIGGIAATFGNVMPYVASYFKLNVEGQSFVSYDLTVWIGSVEDCGVAVSAVLGGVLEKKFGPRCAVTIGFLIFGVGVFTSYFAVQKSFWLWVFTYGAMTGIGQGIAYTPPLTCAMKWLPKNKGLSNGLLLMGFGIGPFIFNFIQTAYVNPWNYAVDSHGYFTQPLLLSRVPTLFIVLAAICVIMGIIGCLLLITPKRIEREESNLTTPLLLIETDRSEFLTVLRSSTFWCLWFTWIFNNQQCRFIVNYYKIFGQTFISDDVLLAGLGSASALLAAFGKIILGHLGDKFSYQSIMTLVTGGTTVFVATVCITKFAGEALYFIWICLVNFIQAGQFALFPMAVRLAFGEENVGVNIGLFLTGTAAGSILTALLTTFLLKPLGYCGMFLLFAAFGFLAFCITLVIHRTRYGSQIGMGRRKAMPAYLAEDNE